MFAGPADPDGPLTVLLLIHLTAEHPSDKCKCDIAESQRAREVEVAACAVWRCVVCVWCVVVVVCVVCVAGVAVNRNRF